MKRKVYVTRRERMIDQILGFLAFPLVNVPLGIGLWMIMQRLGSRPLTQVSILPWLVNLIIIVSALLLRPEFAIGYIAFISTIVALAIGASVVFMAACFVTILTVPVTGDLAGLLFVILMVVGLYYLAGFAMQIFKSWRASHKDTLQ